MHGPSHLLYPQFLTTPKNNYNRPTRSTTCSHASSPTLPNSMTRVVWTWSASMAWTRPLTVAICPANPTFARDRSSRSWSTHRPGIRLFTWATRPTIFAHPHGCKGTCAGVKWCLFFFLMVTHFGCAIFFFTLLSIDHIFLYTSLK